jgi:hypothetical protein
VIGITLFVLLYSLVAVSNILLGAVLSLLLVGGYLSIQLLRQLLSLFGRLVAAREREAQAAEARAAVAAESTGVEFDPSVDGSESDAAEKGDDAVEGADDETATEASSEWAD